MRRAGPWPRTALAAAFLVAAAVSLAAADARASYQLGRRAQEAGDWASAVEQYRAALSANPAYLEAAVGLAETLLALDEPDEAARWVARARQLDPVNPDWVVLDGRIRLAGGDTAGARALFAGVLRDWPNNLEARFGMAEADVADGRPHSAMERYGAALAIAPLSRRGLLSLAILSESEGDTASADRAMEAALRTYPGDVGVQLAASDLSGGRGRWDLAERHARSALTLAPQSSAARLALATAHIALGRFDAAADELREIVAADRSNARAWYALGVAYQHAGDLPKALNAFGSALAAAPDDEIARIVEEYAAIDGLKAEDPQRASLARFHRDAGELLENRSLLEKALAEYRRSLLLDPTSRDGRIGYARVYRTMGYPGKQLSELKALVGLGVKDSAILDEVEGLEAQLDGTVSKAWGVDQYDGIRRRPWTVTVSTMESADRLLHPRAAPELIRAFADLLLRWDAIEVPGGGVTVGGLDAALRSAVSSRSDYVLMLAMEESERTFSASASVYLAKTGAPVASYTSLRTGNDRVRDAFLRVAQQLAEALPARGTLVKRRFDQGLIDLGARQGMNVGQRLDIVRRGRVAVAADAAALAWADADVVGEFTVTAVDEAVSAGSIRPRGMFDLVNERDEVVVPHQAAAPAPAAEAPAARPGLLARLRALFGR